MVVLLELRSDQPARYRNAPLRKRRRPGARRLLVVPSEHLRLGRRDAPMRDSSSASTLLQGRILETAPKAQPPRVSRERITPRPVLALIRLLAGDLPDRRRARIRAQPGGDRIDPGGRCRRRGPRRGPRVRADAVASVKPTQVAGQRA